LPVVFSNLSIALKTFDGTRPELEPRLCREAEAVGRIESPDVVRRGLGDIQQTRGYFQQSYDLEQTLVAQWPESEKLNRALLVTLNRLAGWAMGGVTMGPSIADCCVLFDTGSFD